MRRRHWELSVDLAACAAVAALTAGLLAGCVGTPMPIPPSIEPDRITLDLSREPCQVPEPEQECIAIAGGPGAVEPGAVLIVNQLFPLMPPMDLPYAIAVADDRGAFGVPALNASPDAALRTIVHGSQSVETLNLLADTSVAPPWPVEALDDEAAGACLAIAPGSVDFGSVAAGDTATTLVEVRNTCEEPRTLNVSYVASWPEAPLQPPFGALGRFAELGQGDAVDVVVAFWPEEVESYVGAIFIDSYGISGGAETLLSIPVRGRAVAP